MVLLARLRRSILPILIAYCSTACTGAASSLTNDGDLGLIVRRAKQEGRKTVMITSHGHEDDTRASAQDYFRDYTVVSGRPRAQHFIAYSAKSLYTWYMLPTSRVLRAGPTTDPGFCQDIPHPAGFVTATGELAVAVMGGNQVIDGVNVTVAIDRPITLGGDTDVLLVGLTCAPKVLVLPHGALDVFEIDRTGALSATEFEPVGFVDKLLSLKTVENVAGYLASLQSGPRSKSTHQNSGG